jgi:hypothetical protein
MTWIMMRGHGRTHRTINPGNQQIEDLQAGIGLGMTVRSKPASSQLVAGNGPI